ncbi:DUF4890 domain-containing protein [Neptunitalea lumnitzerae]|uniref:LTXXQ motif family protein n=1 Tax=Neptunitalea lumnitzerae TaxID=2965509 RepID=A0ABQ5MN21_9FLAO|nr:DUF4890 domain-containing protein [Neptunitalea sp. Y10]GLB50803.1 hypothetical protein Y10_31710 [Neptunitalea sp. Y10]
MKKLLVLAAILVTSAGIAQTEFKGRGDREHRGQHQPRFERMMDDYTPEQMATLKTKKMTLALDLTEKQQKELLKINTEVAKKHKAKFEEIKAKREEAKAKGETPQRPTSEERFAMQNARLDEQIAMRTKMKSLLTDEQYKKWSEMKESRKDKMKEHFKGRMEERKEGQGRRR